MQKQSRELAPCARVEQMEVNLNLCSLRMCCVILNIYFISLNWKFLICKEDRGAVTVSEGSDEAERRQWKQSAW